jgi:hypothetical protein
MDTTELKFVLKLLGFDDYRAPLSKIQPNNQTRASEREKIGRTLCDRELVDCSKEVTKLKITPPGKALLKLDPAELPVTEQELKVLRASEKEKISPGKTNVPAAQRQAIIQSLVDRGLIEVETKIKEVWLSDRGREYLRDDYSPKGSQPTISLDMLNNYCRFLRKSLSVETAPSTSVNNGIKNGVSPQTPTSESQPSDKEILQIIRDLDRQLGTENYLPISHLRQKLEPRLSREQLDQTLYRLQKDNQIDLSTLAEPDKCTPEQINAGIPQRRGGLLFFITVN